MEGKYRSRWRFYAARLRRLPLRMLLACMQGWSVLRQPDEGYTIILGNYAPLTEILLANFALLVQQDLRNLKEIIVVSDRPRHLIEFPIEDTARRQFPQLPLTFIYYNKLEYRVFAAIGWAYTYCWKSWCKAIARTRTRYAIIHDMDAMLLRTDIFEERYQAIVQNRAQYVGVHEYRGNGILKTDRLVTTWEMMFDVEFVRRRFRPVDLFNQVCKVNGRTVDLDCFLDAQARDGKSLVVPVDAHDMVHPSQVITQYTYLLNKTCYVPPEGNNLPMIPYFYALAGYPQQMSDLALQMRSRSGRIFTMFARPLDLSRMLPKHATWLREQAMHLENRVYGGPRPEVSEYFAALLEVASRPQTHGKAPAPAAA